jgi:acrylyl-CoA reductase (NADPH)
METYKALRIHERSDGMFDRVIEQCPLDTLGTEGVLIRVHFAALNYKDALSASGHKGITRNFPHTPGVDAAGVVVEDASGKWSPGAEVICTSYDLGMNTNGGFAEYIRVPATWIIEKPAAWSLKQSMAMGTAAYTAALALYKMEACGQHTGMGQIAVTGATGGVGSMAVSILSKAGYRVLAISGKKESEVYLKNIGATEVAPRLWAFDESERPLLKSRWAGAIDNVGGKTLATLLKACGRNGSVASIGLVESSDLQTTVYPFILNGVNLLGVDSAETPQKLRQIVWDKLASVWYPEKLSLVTKEVSLEEIPGEMDLILKGSTQGRIVAKLI